MKPLYLLATLMAFSTQAISAIPVYRSPNSRYNSGQADLSLLQKNVKTISLKSWYQTKHGDKMYWLEKKHFYHPSDFARIGEIIKTTFTYSQPNYKSKTRKTINAKEKVLIREHRPLWLKVSPLKNPARKLWVEHSNLLAKDIFTGFVYAKDRAILYRKAHEKSRILTLLNVDTKIRVLSVEDRWLNIQFGKLNGYVLIEQVIGPWALAHSVNFGNRWHQVKNQVEDKLISIENVKMPISQISNLKFSSKKRVVKSLGATLRSEPSHHSPSLVDIEGGTALYIYRTQSERWAESHISYIGDVWWQMQDSLKPRSLQKFSNVEFFSRKIFDMASSPAKAGLVFASAKGLFKTVDGHTWYRVDRFGEKNLPLAIAKSGRVFAGPYFSNDDGSTFQSYIRWDRFLKSLQRTLPKIQLKDLANVKMKKVTVNDTHGQNLILRLMVGEKSIDAKTKNFGKTWAFRINSLKKK